MFWQKEEIVDLLIGKVSLTTIKENKQMILNEYDRKFKTVATLKEKFLANVLNYASNQAKYLFGYKDMYHLEDNKKRIENKKAEKLAAKFLLEFKLDKKFENLFIDMNYKKEIEKEREKVANM